MLRLLHRLSCSHAGVREQVITLLRAGAAFALLMSSPMALGKFEFGGFSVNAIEISESNDLIPYTFTVRYRPFEGDTWTGSNPFANYRLGLSDNGVYDPVRLTYTELEKSFQWSSIKVRPSMGTPPQAPINSKGWTHGQGSGLKPGSGPAQYLTATFEVNLKPQGLRDLFNAGKTLDFCVHGEENSNTTFFEDPYDDQCMSIQINYPANVKVSGLKDMSIAGDNSGIDGYYQNQMDFCVYVSRAPHNYRIGFMGGNGEKFELESSSGDRLPYIVQFADSIANLNSATEHSSFFIVPNNTNGSDSLNCDSHTANNAAVRVKVNKAQADNTTDGAYMDTVTVLVQAT
ncbi:hypothetical protein [Candidatus Sororendozoicomonas aggregata]|uniref:hypothetical protein n=1 Tax=Candidatus Sororendozoicomonas aggregata TaxID=3073239 RepID=UPI002ED14B9B